MKPWLLSSLLLLFVTRCFGSVVAISTKSLPNGTVGAAYSAVIQASGGCTPYAWSIVSGSLPAGITATPSTTTKSLNLSGTPTTAATSSFTVDVKGCGGRVSQVSYNIIIQSTPNHVVDLSWSASTSNDVSGYNVYRAPDRVNWQRINTSVIAPTVYSDSTVANGSTYYYAATAVDINGNESAKSAAVQAVVP
jgi:hypothetical protein